MVPPRILLTDDEPDLVWAVCNSLSDQGFEVATADNGVEALSLALRQPFDLIILDIMMPGLDGLEVCRLLRLIPSLAATPILFLTARGNVEDRVRGLEEGGDDYLVKPFDLRELNARVKILLRRVNYVSRREAGTENQEAAVVIGSLFLNLQTRRIHIKGKEIQLTPTEFDLLHFLMKNSGRIFSSQQLLKKVWGYPEDTADPSLVRWHIRNLRGKIEPDPSRPVYIQSVARYGYMIAVEPNAILT